MSERIAGFYGGEDPEAKTPKVLTGTKNTCPMCGNKFRIDPPLIPNTKDREFYGGRVKFFKDVSCICTGEYRICIEQKYNAKEQKMELVPLDMIVLKPGKTRDELIEEQTNKAVHEKFLEGRIPTMREREEVKKEAVLATIVDIDTKIETLCYHTIMELQAMCKRERVSYTKNDNKKQLAKKLLAKNPNLVSAD